MSGSGREALQHVQELSVDPLGCLEPLPDVWEWSGGPPECPGVVGKPSRRSESGREALTDVWEWSRVFPECPGVVGRPSRMSGSG